MNTFQHYPELDKQLAAVRELMRSSITLKHSAIKDAILSLINTGGKMLRPSLLLLFADFCDFSPKKTLALAASSELLHTATLIHDDVIDQATSRRGIPTIAHVFGPDVAVYAGDYLFTVVFKLLSQNELNHDNLLKHADSMERLLAGELGQMSQRYDLDQSLTSYLDNIAGKTAELFAISAAATPLAVGNHRLAKQAFQIGKKIGMAFQILDDYLDYTSDSNQLGKPVLEDVKQGIYSAPLLFARDIDYKQVAQYISDKDYDSLHQFVATSGALADTLALANKYTEEALKHIAELPELPSRTILYNLTQALLGRTV